MEAIVGMDSAYKVAMFEKEKVGNMYVSSALVCDMYERIAELEAEKAERETQEPSAKVKVLFKGKISEFSEIKPLQPLLDGQLLYAQPVQPAVPDGWISVDDKSPEDDTLVLAFHPDWGVELVEMYQGKWRCMGLCSDTPTHWMPLPAAPKENT